MRYIFPILVIILLFSVGCKKENVITENKNNNSTDKSNHNAVKETKQLKRYLKEGFISQNQFRVIIISPNESDESISDIKDKAEKRAQSSLTSFLQMKNRNITYNTRAQILTIIRNNGSIYKKDIQYKKGKVYYFDIKKNRLKPYLYGISSR